MLNERKEKELEYFRKEILGGYIQELKIKKANKNSIKSDQYHDLIVERKKLIKAYNQIIKNIELVDEYIRDLIK